MYKMIIVVDKWLYALNILTCVMPKLISSTPLNKSQRIKSLSWEYSCDEGYVKEFNKGKILKYSLYSQETDLI